ncbi:MAG: nucleotidyltransferase domain-containing protein [Deltaproteobacteria bacterium]
MGRMEQKAFDLSQGERDRLSQRLGDVLGNRDDVVFAYVYGSFVEGVPFHDIDVGIYISKIDEKEASSYNLALGQALSKEMQMPVDVRILNFAPVLFLYHVIRGNMIFDRDEETRSCVVERTIQRYLDLKPMIHRGVKEAFGV